jgi:prevent-host-death family protein
MAKQAILTRRNSISVSATEAQNEFGRILDTVAKDRVVVITRHNTPKAVLMSVGQFEALTGEDTLLDTLTAEFDALLDRMQRPEVRAALREAYHASPEEFGEAAVEAARASD